jgi:peptide chain release factor 1
VFDKLKEVERRFVSLEESLSQPSLTGSTLVQLTKERAELEPIVQEYRQYEGFLAQKIQLEEMLQGKGLDPELKDMAQEELIELEVSLQACKKKLIVLMLPPDPNDKKNVILEIRAGTGGDEAGIFVADLLRMYIRYAESCRWTTEVLSAHESTKGGYKEVILHITGSAVYSRLKFESGVHRVQRIPVTESQGRIHTSACTVAVLPEVEDVEVEINPADLKVDTYRSSGAGGQHVNTTDSAVRITHMPTGVIAECQEERSQHKNREKAMKMLRTRIYDKMQSEQDREQRANRKQQVGSGDRSERIRTYNFPQGRLTDHRVNLTLYRLDAVMDGDLNEILDTLGAHHTAERLQHEQEP